jgi:NADH:ubiquinone oxidoreductase subunit 3 (subunit A)
VLVEYVGLLAMFVASLFSWVAVLGVSAWIRARSKRVAPALPEHLEDPKPPSLDGRERAPVECGGKLRTRPGEHIGVGFYSLSILFLLFNLASFYFYAWGANFRASGMEGLVAMSFFALCLAVAWFYSWAKGVF